MSRCQKSTTLIDSGRPHAICLIKSVFYERWARKAKKANANKVKVNKILASTKASAAKRAALKKKANKK